MNRDVGGVTERTVLLGMVLLLSAASSAIVFVLTQYFGTPAFSSLVFQPLDCRAGGWQPVLGQHCFADYGWSVKHGMRPNPWDGFTLYTGDINDYSAAALMPPLLFAVLAGWLHAPSVGVLTYVLVLAIAVLFPAAWAARGACGLERLSSSWPAAQRPFPLGRRSIGPTRWGSLRRSAWRFWWPCADSGGESSQ